MRTIMRSMIQNMIQNMIQRERRPSFPKRESGVATLVVVLVLLFSISGLTLYAANTGILEQKISGNDYRSRQLSDAAEAGIEFAIAWLAGNTPTWVTDPGDADYEIADEDLAVDTANGFNATIQLRRSVAARERVTLTAIATQTDGGNAPTSTSRVTILQYKLVKGKPDTPIMINGSLTNVNGSPTIGNTSSTAEIVTSQSAASIEQGNFSSTTGFDVQGDAFDGSAWDRTFGVSQAQMQAMSTVEGSGVYWITQSTPWNTNLGSLGSPAQPVIAIFTNCAKINGGTQIVGIVYYSGTCSGSGWGGANIYGSIVVDGDIDSMNANTNLAFDASYIDGLMDQTIGVKSRVPGTWIDQ